MLHDRPGINLAARFLSSRKQVVIGINIDVRRSG